MNATPDNSKRDPFLDEVQRLKHEAAGDRDWRELAERLREIERRYSNWLIRPPEKPGTNAA